MAEKEPGSPKKATRPRRRKVQPVENEESGVASDSTPTESSRPAMDDAFQESGSVRAEFHDTPSQPRPTEREMDFDTVESPSTGESFSTGESSSDFSHSSYEGAPSGDMGGDYPSSDYSTGDDQPRRRRRRRGRGRGYLNQGEGSGGTNTQMGTGSHSNQRQRGRNGQQDRRNGQFSNQGGHRRQHGGGQHGGSQHGGGQRQFSNEPRPPEVPTPVQGTLELHPKGYGFIRDPKAGYISQETDAFVSAVMIEKLGLREGVHVTGEMVPGGRGQGPRLKTIQTIEGRLPEAYTEVKKFDELTPINPYQQIKLETGPSPITMRVMDLLTPIGKGQRALLVAPPRSGKTMLLQEIANAVSTNYPEIYLIVLLIDERPEEVTEMRRRVNGEVVASSLDREVENHIRVSQLVFEKAKRMAESGRDVFLLLDSITRTARAFNKWTNTGRTGTGGLDVKAMDIPKKMFGMARQFDEGGSLTVVGTALIETGSKMDE
ncbi:MAG: transcription termination factor Rho, partial [Planctomycetes bacterium]|nr:transcription termination factor Rho [Planctomycetota bacterium]